MADMFFFIFILFTGFTGIFASSYCTDYYSWDGENNHGFWCDEGCCGSHGNQQCCDSSVGAIVGIVIGCLLFVALVVSVLVAIFCCCRRSRGQTGQVCQPAVAQATTVNMQSALPYGQVGYNVAVNIPVTVMTSNVTPGTTQPWQQPVLPPKYEEVVQNQ